MTRAEGMAFAIRVIAGMAAAGDADAVEALLAITLPTTTATEDEDVSYVEHKRFLKRENQRRYRKASAYRAPTEAPTRAPTKSPTQRLPESPVAGTSESLSETLASPVLTSEVGSEKTQTTHANGAAVGAAESPTQAPTEAPTQRAPRKADAETAAAVDQVFAHWVRVMGKNPATTKLTKQRRAKVQQRLREGYDVATLCAAVDGCKRSPFHMGDNDRGQPYNDLEVILRSGSTVEQHRDRTGAAPVTAPKPLHLVELS